MCCASLMAQNSISGTITNTKSKALIGANVYITGTSIGTATNKNGHYQLKNISNGEHEVTVSYSGYKRIKQKVQFPIKENILNFSLEISNKFTHEIVVTGTGTKNHLRNSPVKTEFISKEKIKDISANDISETLASISPSFDFSPGSMGSFMSLNGLSNKYILVLVDGKRLSGDVGGNIDLNRINSLDIDHIEIVKGASSSLYGSEAMAGVINIITKQSKHNISIENNSRIADFGQWQQNNNIKLNIGKFSSKTIFNHKQSDGWQLNTQENKKNRKTKIYELKDTDAKPVNTFNDYEIKQEITYNANEKLSINALISKYDKEVESPISVRKYNYLHRNIDYSIGAQYLLNKKGLISLNYNTNDYRYTYQYNQDVLDKKKNLINTRGEKSVQKEQRRNDLDFKTVYNVNKNNKISFGSTYTKELLESSGRLDIEKEIDVYSLAAFVQDEMKINKNLSIFAGLRYTKHEKFGNAFSPKISALYNLDKLSFRMAYSEGFKAPTLKELYYKYQKKSYLYLGNKDLKAQKNKYYSFSIDYNSKNFSISLSPYINKLNDMIAYKIIDTTEEDADNGTKTTKEHYNIGKAQTRGIDIMCNVYLGSGFSASAGYSYVDAKDKIEDIRLNGIAYNYATTKISWKNSWENYKLRATFSGRIQDSKFYNDDKGNAKGYNIWKLNTNHTFAQVGDFKFEANAGIENIFDYVDDNYYGMHYGTLSPGRTFYIGCNISFYK